MEQQEDFMVVNFSATGMVTAMHRDAFDLGFLGKQSVSRASEIKFNEDTQLWDVYLPVDYHRMQWHAIDAACGFAGYNEARQFEVKWLENCALNSVEPLRPAGIAIAALLRDLQ